MKINKNFLSHLTVGLAALVFGFGLHHLIYKASGGNEQKQVYAIVDGEKVTAEQVLPKIKEDLRQLQRNIYHLKKKAVEDFVLEKMGSAQKGPLSDAVDKDQYNLFLKQRKIDLTKLTPKQQEDLLANFKIHTQLLANKAQAKASIAESQIQWLIPMTFLDPPVKVGKGFLPPLMQSASKKTIVLFANYHCAYCPGAYQKILDLQKRMDGQLNIYFRFAFTEPIESVVGQAAIATVCAHEQGQFESFFKEMFEHPPMDPVAIGKIAEKSNLDMSKFETCLLSLKTKQKIDNDIRDAKELGVPVEALAFVNGHPLSLRAAIDDLDEILQSP